LYKQNQCMLWVFPKPLCILFSDTKGIQWVDTDASVETYTSRVGVGWVLPAQ